MICPKCGAKVKYRKDIVTVCIVCSAQRVKERQRIRLAGALAVKHSIEAGLLRPPYEYKCVDCGLQAKCYDHRDYSKPYMVEPVCKSCDGKRGSGKPWKGCRIDAVERAMAFEKNRKIVKRWYIFKGDKEPQRVSAILKDAR